MDNSCSQIISALFNKFIFVIVKIFKNISLVKIRWFTTFLGSLKKKEKKSHILLLSISRNHNYKPLQWNLSTMNQLGTNFFVLNRQGVQFVYVELTKISDTGTLFKVPLILIQNFVLSRVWFRQVSLYSTLY